VVHVDITLLPIKIMPPGLQCVDVYSPLLYTQPPPQVVPTVLSA
jgi:hypothetical protein